MLEMRRWIFVLALALSVFYGEAGLSPDQLEKMATGFRNTCVGKTGADAETVLKMRQGQFPDDPKLACYTRCIIGLGRAFKNGRVDKDMMLKQLNIMAPDDKLERMTQTVYTCTAIAPFADECAYVYEYVKCNYNADPEVFWFP